MAFRCLFLVSKVKLSTERHDQLSMWFNAEKGFKKLASVEGRMWVFYKVKGPMTGRVYVKTEKRSLNLILWCSAIHWYNIFISQEAQGTDENPLLDITRDTLAHLVDAQTAASGCQDPSQSNEPSNEVFDSDEKFLEEMEIDRNWQIPREKLEILEEKLGTGEFGVVCKGFYLRRDGSKMPVAIKTLRGLCSIFWYSKCISSNIIIDN